MPKDGSNARKHRIRAHAVKTGSTYRQAAEYLRQQQTDEHAGKLAHPELSRRDLLELKARYRAQCTGIGHEDSLQHAKGAQEEGPVPEARYDQARLEAAVFERLGGTIDYCAHPAGIARIHPSTDHLIVEIDPKLGPDHSLAERCLQALLPTQYTGPAAEGEEQGPGGITGVRILTIDNAGLHLGLAGTDARVTLTGPTAKQWQTLAREHHAACRNGNLTPLWDTPELTSFEAVYLAHDPAWWKEQDDSAWIASGLLRRIALFHTVTKPYSLRYWPLGLGWRFEVRYDHDVPVNHDAPIAAWTHPTYGMPLRATRESCKCKRCDCDGGAERICWYTLDSGRGRHSEIGIHFRRERANQDDERAYTRLVAAGADPAWLRQAMPSRPHHGATEHITE